MEVRYDAVPWAFAGTDTAPDYLNLIIIVVGVVIVH